MKRIWLILIKMLIFLLVLFTSMRIIFLLNYCNLFLVEKVPFMEILKGFFKAFPLDLSTACYMLALPALAMFVGIAINKNVSFRFIRWFFYLLIAAYVLIVMGDIGIYGEWRTKLSYKALVYLEKPSEVFNSAETGKSILLIILWILFTILFCWWYVYWLAPKKTNSNKNKINAVSYVINFILVFGLLFLGIRGGLNEIAITSGKVYYSNYKIANDMTVNPAYNLVENILNSKKVETKVHFNYMDMQTAKRRTEALHKVECESTIPILKIKNPNIIVVLLESWSADLIESLGGKPGITPNFREMEKNGLLFTNIYASANRSQQAISSLFGGLPGIPVTTITNHPDKYYAIPSFVKKLDSIGYYTSFYFGGELNYGNILSYLRYNEFDKIVEGKDVDKHFTKGKMGIHDTDMLPWYAEQLVNHPQPFFSTVFTLSSHSPYDYPKNFEEIKWPEIEKRFINSAYYTDSALKLFMDVSKQQNWYDSTLFVFIADHSHPSYKNHRMESFDYHKIPMLIYGEPLQDSLKGKTFDKICGNTDFPASILAQLGLKHDEFFWSKDVFNICYKPFAFFELANGVGWKTPEGEFVYSNIYNFIKNSLPPQMSDSIVMDGKAYMQYHFDLFNSY